MEAFFTVRFTRALARFPSVVKAVLDHEWHGRVEHERNQNHKDGVVFRFDTGSGLKLDDSVQELPDDIETVETAGQNP